ncbi:hypothetical protein MO867_21470 [Microbulbifer sp. OS29]|uniref:Uncharacterized protein n=1 Tax=Microbulbifer okhotskensis TaxID=2926617 RepID=A0A9X2J9R9_9GAMM|nr:hypothetical protein [Microbulbifer okhotskensis]MCO1336901.1 hypothetical protein [Microbulbifer okhotskensis]
MAVYHQSMVGPKPGEQVAMLLVNRKLDREILKIMIDGLLPVEDNK